jgi:hypothetical protein
LPQPIISIDLVDPAKESSETSSKDFNEEHSVDSSSDVESESVPQKCKQPAQVNCLAKLQVESHKKLKNLQSSTHRNLLRDSKNPLDLLKTKPADQKS